MKKTALLLAASLMTVSMLGAVNTAAADKYTLKLGVVITEDDPLFKGLEQMKAEAEEKSEGRLEIELFPSSQLGDTGELVEQAVSGANVGTIAGAPFLQSYCEDFGILMGPYLMNSYEDCMKVTSSDLYQSWVDEIAKSNVQVLCFNYQQGPRYMVTKQPVVHPEDMKGMMIRTFSQSLPFGAVEKTGAVGSTLSWGEVYTGLQQKVIDGAEAQISAISGSSLEEVAPYIAKTGHFQMLSGLVIGSLWYDTLPDDLKEILTTAAINGGVYASDLVYEKEAEYEKTLTEKGAVITEVDVDEWKAAMDPIYDELNLRDLKNAIDEIIAG
ncbi:MAG: C4-dicarboxylate TRAP transporter substrate-binding protein [Lachnospiraceae bacterium]|nr:C4-dicarboxylate TRAP transporter substrate-binding protein [Lachnospiraceae bacterium]